MLDSFLMYKHLLNVRLPVGLSGLQASKWGHNGHLVKYSHPESRSLDGCD